MRTNKRYEWLESEDQPNRATIEALGRNTNSRDMEVPERIDVGAVPSHANKRYHTVLDLGAVQRGAVSSSGAATGASTRYVFQKVSSGARRLLPHSKFRFLSHGCPCSIFSPAPSFESHKIQFLGQLLYFFRKTRKLESTAQNLLCSSCGHN